MQKPAMLGFLECSEVFHNCIPTQIQNPVIFRKFMNIQKSDIFKTNTQRLKIEFFAKIVKKLQLFFQSGPS